MINGMAVFRRNSDAGAGRRRRRTVAWACAGLLVAVVGWSFGSYVLVDNGDTMDQRAVTWGRDHHLGGLVDLIERERYSSPPAKHTASHLGVNNIAGTTGSTGAGLSPAGVGPATTSPIAELAGPASGAAPAPLLPRVAPSLVGEGAWQVIDAAGGVPAIWAASIRPNAAYPSVVASVAEIDQTHLHFGLFNGNEVPGGSGWQLGDHVPPELQPALVAAFNGGFRFDNEPGGYVTEGRTVRPLLAGQATLAIDRNGRLFVGEYGRDLNNDGRWESLRQNLPLIVDNGVSQAMLKPGTNWGRNYHNVIYVTRSAVCLRGDGHYAYVTVGPVDARMLGDALVVIGCLRAIELDINGTWPTFVSFHQGARGQQTPMFLDRRMGGNPNRYLTGSSKEFFAAFDVSRLQPNTPLETR